jgi:hypothetical protein
MLVDPAPDAEGRELVQAYAANDRAQGLHTNLIHYGFAPFAPVAYAMVGLVRRRGAWIANLAGLLAVLGLSTLPGLVFIDYFSVAVEHVAGLEQAVNAEGAVEKLPGFGAVTVPAFISAILAVPGSDAGLVAGSPGGLVDTARSSRGLSRSEYPAGPAIVAFSVMAVGMLVVGWALWRIPVVAWYGTDPSDQLDAARNAQP